MQTMLSNKCSSAKVATKRVSGARVGRSMVCNAVAAPPKLNTKRSEEVRQISMHAAAMSWMDSTLDELHGGNTCNIPLAAVDMHSRTQHVHLPVHDGHQGVA